MDETNTNIFTHAKLEYTSQLIDTLTPHIFDGVKSVYDEAKIVHKTNTTVSILFLFREFLEKVPSWSNEIVETETNRIIEMSTCDWIDDLITAVFISHTKILTSIGNNQMANIDLTIPKTINFIHKCYINIAREIWKNPYLFDDFVLGSEYQKNMRTVELMIKDSIENTIRKLLPVKEILKQHLDTYEANNLEIQKRNASLDLRKLLLKELKELNLIKNDIKDEDDDELLEKKDDKSLEKEKLLEKLELLEENIDDNDNLNNDVNNDVNNKDNDDDINNKDNDDDVNNKDNDGDVNNTDNDDVNNALKTTVASGVVEDYVSPPPSPKPVDYDSPDEATIKEQCDGLQINTIPDVTKDEVVDVPIVQEQTLDLTSSNKEEKYDNVNIVKIDNAKTDLMNTFVQNLPKIEDSTITKTIEEIKNPPPSPNNDPLFNSKQPEVKKIEEVKQPEVKKIEDVKVIKDQSKEIITVSKTPNSDDETVDEFFNDVTRLIEQKGINVNKEAKSYTLFDDADEKE